MDLHSLLKRQLMRQFGSVDNVPEGVRAFVDMVNDAYRESDSDRAMLERSLELSSQELLQANAEMRAVFSGFPDVFVWLDGNGTVRNVQGGTGGDRLFGKPGWRGKRIQDIPQSPVGRKFKGAIRLVHDSQSVVPVEYELEVDGQVLFYEARLLPLMRNQILAIIRNITDRKLAQEALGAEKERLAVTLRSIGDAVITTDVDGRVRLMNRVAEQLTGHTQTIAFDADIEDVFVLESDSRENVENPARRVLADRDAARSRVTARLVRKDGATVVVDASAAVILDRDSDIVGVVVVARDITESRKLEEEQRRASKLESVGILAGGIAHDFNNILTSILGSISLSRMYLDDPEDRTAALLSTAEKASLRARDLTQQLLTFSKGGTPIKETASAEDLIRESVGFALRGSNVRCVFELVPDLWSIEVDPSQISQVINNLIINADQAMPDGGKVVIGAENIAPGEMPKLPYSETGHVRLYVRDTGIGIAREDLDKIFDPYFTTKQRGSGLGLATCYSIVVNHDGLLTAESTLGVGTTMSVFVPASRSAVERKPAEAGIVGRGQGRILLMDDEEHVLEVCGRMLEFLGYSVEFARTGKEAVDVYSAACGNGSGFDAIIVDLTVPGGMGGKEAVAELREIDPEINAIASSGYSNDPVMASFGDHGFRGILAKPYNIQELDRTLAALLGG